MNASTPKWSVVATVDEPPALIQSFVAWHLALGASEIWLFFDRADDPAADLIAPLPDVRRVICDDQHWARIGRARPERHQIRQSLNANFAFGQSKTAWMLHCDADEFLLPNGDVGEILSGCAPETDGVVVKVAERIYLDAAQPKTIFSGGFRLPYVAPRKAGAALFGADFDLTSRGLTGHSLGKSFSRVGRGCVTLYSPPPFQEAQKQTGICPARCRAVGPAPF